MKQAEYFNCSSYRKNLKRTCTSHQVTVKAITAIIQDDLKRTIHFAKNHNEEFLQTLRKDAEAKTKINGHYRQTVEIVYNFVGTIEPQFFDDDETYN